MPSRPFEIRGNLESSYSDVFTPEALAAEPKVAPWDLCAVLTHARERRLFPA